MKILHVVPHYEPDLQQSGVIQSTSILCRELGKLGHSVVVHTTKHHDGDQSRPLGRPIDIHGVEVVYFQNWFGAFGFGADMVRASRQIKDFDVVHVAAFWQLLGLPALVSAMRASVPTVVSPRGSLVMLRNPIRDSYKHRAFYWTLNKHLLKGVSAIHVTAEAERSDARALHIKTPSFCIPNALRIEEFQTLPPKLEARAALGIEADRPTILFVGRLDRRKALDMLLRAFARVSGRGTEAILILAGPDEGEEAKLRKLVGQLGLSERVRFEGLVDADQRAQLLAAADLATLTSLAENFGNAAAEAMAAGVPVLVTDQCGVADGVEQAGVGRVIPVDESAVASALDQLLDDPESLKHMASRAAQFAQSRYAAREVATTTARAYEDLIAGVRSEVCRWSV